jgi:hypothetical protein
MSRYQRALVDAWLNRAKAFPDSDQDLVDLLEIRLFRQVALYGEKILIRRIEPLHDLIDRRGTDREQLFAIGDTHRDASGRQQLPAMLEQAKRMPDSPGDTTMVL